MKFCTFETKEGFIRSGWVEGDQIADMNQASKGLLPDNMLDFLKEYERHMEVVKSIFRDGEEQKGRYLLEDVTLKAPLPNPTSLRDFYAFEEHVKTARGRRGLDVVPEWYEIPVFYFSNHLAIVGPGESVVKPEECKWLDYELEIACVIGREGRNIRAEEAEEYIFGYCIMNDWSARDLQRKEMKVGLGPAKGKDFATSLGPYIVTKDELEPFRLENRFDLDMIARVNGKELSRGNLKDIYYSFPQMIERASRDVTLYPGDVIGSGTVGSGCILELGTDVHRWLEPGDEVELEITGLGKLRNTIAERGE